MSTTWDWPGSHWWRVDLHAHSPASYDFKPETDRVAADWLAWVVACRTAGLHAVALTDHNTPDGVPGIQEAQRNSSGIIVFPGVEATVGGIHILCILDPRCGRDDVVSMLSKLGIDPSAFGTHEASSTKSIVEAFEIANASGAIVVAAHVNGPKGLLTLSGVDRLKALKHAGLAAAEIALVAPSDPDETWLDPTGDDVQTWLDGSNTNGRKITQVWGSDSHSHAHAGRQFTWVKMTRPDIEGLRLAFLDGDGSVLPSLAPQDPNRHASNVIESITVTKAKFMGRPEPMTVHFNPWFNAIIGSRGTGKSTLVDFCRVALRRENELDGGGETTLRSVLDKRMRIPVGRHDEGLITSDTVVDVVYRKDGERFSLAWDKQGQMAPISRLNGTQRVPESGDINERFPIRIYSQKQLFDLAKDPDALLVVIDDTPEVRGSELMRASKEAETKYLSLCAEARSLKAKAADLPARQATLNDVRRKVEVLQQGGHAQTLSEFRLRRLQDDSWTDAQRLIEENILALEQQTNSLSLPALAQTDEDGPDPAIQVLKRMHQEASSALGNLRAEVTNSIQRTRARIAAITLGDDAVVWSEVVETSEQGYTRVTEQLAQAGIANPDEYRDLLLRAETLEQEIRTLQLQFTTGDEREQEAKNQLDVYRNLRRELTDRRTQFAIGATNSLIRAEIKEFGDSSDFEAFLRNSLGIERFDEDQRVIVEMVVSPIEENSGWSFHGLDSAVTRLREVVSDPKEKWLSTDRRFEAALRRLQPERIDRLALYTPQDSVDVSFRDPRDSGNQWRKLSQGSPGQQTAALLAFVLGYGEEPIILDQPEDDLDNTLIYELLVQRLRDSKQSRQIIVVTHNPNIVVHGDAELVVSLEAVSGQSKIKFAGGLQEQEAREEICRVMEGGRQAFETRYRRISGVGRRHTDGNAL